LNPSFKQPLIVGSSGAAILLPFVNAQNFEKNLKAYKGPLSSWTTYTVTARERPAALATRIGIDPATLISVNKIPAGVRLRSGSTLLVPKNSDSDEDISADVVENAVLSTEPDLPDRRRVLLRFKRTETIAQIARRYHVSTRQIQSWNRTRKTSFKPGQVVLLHLPANQALPKTVREPTRRVGAAALRGGTVKVSVAARTIASSSGANKKVIRKNVTKKKPVVTARGGSPRVKLEKVDLARYN
jgi:membrane-bound lytic murein transglycosylase D